MSYSLDSTPPQCDSISVAVSGATCSYQAPYDPTSLRTMPRHKSLPSINSTMYSAESSPKKTERNVKRSDSTNSLRRSVPGMKCLLPLKLSSSLPTSTWSSPTPIQRSNFGFVEHLVEDHTSSEQHQIPRRRLRVPRPITIRRENYRDTPVYTELGSPSLSLAYYTDEEVCANPSPIDSCDNSSIIHGCASSSSGRENFEELDEETPLPQQSPLLRRRLSRTSELSFQCLGESETLCKSMFRDEAAWLSSPLNRWNSPRVNSLPQLLAENIPVEPDIETWLSDTSSDCDDEFYACATVLAPAKAHVVDLNSKGLSITIPPRSSSLVGTRPHSLTIDGGRPIRTTFPDSFDCDIDQFDPWIEDDSSSKPWLFQPPLARDFPDFARNSPPLSPIRVSRPRAAVELQEDLDLDVHPDEFTPPPPTSDSISQIISDLDKATSQFPSSTLLPDTPCISAIRVHLRQSSQSQRDIPPPLPSPFSEGVDWRPRRTPSIRRPKTSYFISLQRTFSSGTSKTLPVSKGKWGNQSTQDILTTPTRQCPTQLPPETPAEANLQPLTAIFPNTPQHLRSALYAHILTYLFLKSLPDHSSLPHPHPSLMTPPASPLNFPICSTMPQSLPSKAADRLGIVITPGPRKINVGDDAIIILSKPGGAGTLTERIKGCIAWLIAEMEDDEENISAGEGNTIDAVFLRALGEVVKGCEQACFNLA